MKSHSKHAPCFFQSPTIYCTLLFCYNPAHVCAAFRLHSQRRRGSGPSRRSVSSVWRQLLTAPLRSCRYAHAPFLFGVWVKKRLMRCTHPAPVPNYCLAPMHILTNTHTREYTPSHPPTHPRAHARTHARTHAHTRPQLRSPTLTFSHAKKETTRRTSSPSARRASSLPTTRLSGCFCTWLIKQYMLLARCVDATFS
jgi:hypothetical protein